MVCGTTPIKTAHTNFTAFIISPNCFPAKNKDHQCQARNRVSHFHHILLWLKHTKAKSISNITSHDPPGGSIEQAISILQILQLKNSALSKLLNFPALTAAFGLQLWIKRRQSTTATGLPR